MQQKLLLIENCRYLQNLRSSFETDLEANNIHILQYINNMFLMFKTQIVHYRSGFVLKISWFFL